MNAKFAIALVALSACFALPTAAFAQHHGDGHSSRGSHTPSSGGYVRGGVALHSGYRGHYYGSSYYRGYRPYYGYGHYYPHYGPLFGGLALGLYVSSLPSYYDTYWWHGAPYYYYDNTYYRYRDSVGKYEVVAPPSDAAEGTADQPVDSQLFAYPKDHQSEDQQRTDRYECHQWAVNETGVDPSKAETIAADKKGDYRRAEGACLTGRGYSVR